MYSSWILGSLRSLFGCNLLASQSTVAVKEVQQSYHNPEPILLYFISILWYLKTNSLTATQVYRAHFSALVGGASFTSQGLWPRIATRNMCWPGYSLTVRKFCIHVKAYACMYKHIHMYMYMCTCTSVHMYYGESIFACTPVFVDSFPCVHAGVHVEARWHRTAPCSRGLCPRAVAPQLDPLKEPLNRSVCSSLRDL